MARRIVFIQGGGLGYDQERAARRVIQAAGVDWDWHVFTAGQAAVEQGKEAIGADLIAAVREAKVALKTKLLSPPEGQALNYNVRLRKELGVFAAVRPIRNVPGLPARFQDVDIVLIREITEDLYAAIEHEIVPGVVESIKVVTEAACRRFFRFTFQWTQDRGRRKIHCIHKANILKQSDGLFLDCFRQAAREFPDIEAKEMIVDNACMQIVSRPGQFDVIATGNLYGDLLSDLGTGLVGGISAAFGVNCGERVRVYEATHGGPAQAVAPGQVNPLPLLFTAVELMRDTGQAVPASRILKAIEEVLVQGLQVRPDFATSTSTEELVEALVSRLT
ncbi:MAG TPA: isocitrate/isopropylmalate family dehydrogenase [Gemmatales bacterium]|nr:isocitrate/isopropylmalate family dehydrogenase [Gemmatales bacterium]HMP59273.1 isocitrate/isopropylmalate family dehydrogenase [Gemmatales bacterium]